MGIGPLHAGRGPADLPRRRDGDVGGDDPCQRHAGRCDDVALTKERELRLRAMQVDLDRKEFELHRLKDQTLPLAQFEFCLQRMCSALLATLNALPGRAAPLLIGLDFHDLKRKLEEEVEIVKRTIRAKDYLPKPDPDVE